MMRIALAFCLSTLLVSTSVADSAGPGKRLVDFLEPGMKVGVLHWRDSQVFSTKVLTEEIHKVLVELKRGEAPGIRRNVSEEEFVEMIELFPSVREGVEREIEKRINLLRKLKKDVPIIPHATEMRLTFGTAFTSLNPCEVKEVGRDYILLTSHDGVDTAYSLPYLRQISWMNEIPMMDRKRKMHQAVIE